MEKQIQILHLEDDEVDAELVQATLDIANIPCQITRVQNAGDFSNALHKGGYDVILADYSLPGYDGLSALNIARDQYSRIPFIFVSGTLGEDAAISALTEGAVDYVTKQKLSRLAPAIRRALQEVENQTKREIAEQELLEREREYRVLVENIPDLIVRYNTVLQRIYVNPAWEKASGLSARDVVNVSPADIPGISNPINDDYMEKLQYVLKTGIAQALEFTWTNAHGKTLSLEYVIVPEYDQHGKIRGVLSVGRDITERKRNERELITLNYAINQSSDAVFLINEKMTFAYVNDAACRSLGYTREELLTMGPSDIDAAITYEAAKDIMNKQFANGSFPRFETQHKTRDGRIFPVEVSSSVVEYDGAKFSLTTVHDITKRKRAENALQEREYHSQSLLRLSRKLEQAQTYSEVLNAAQDEVRDVVGYQNLWAYLFTPDKKQAKALFARGPISDSVMSEDETATLTIQGDRMMEEIVETRDIVIVEDARTDERTDKKIVEKMKNRTLVNIPILLFDMHMGSIGVGTFGDEGVLIPTASQQEYLKALASHMAVTLDRIHLLEERRQAEQSLRESENRFRVLSENAFVGIYIIQDGRLSYVNSTLAKIFGYTPEELTGADPALVIHSDDHAMVSENIRRRIDGEVETVHYEFHGQCKDGVIKNIEVLGGRVDFGGKTAVIGNLMDITERKQAEEALRESETKFRAVFESSVDAIGVSKAGIHTFVNPAYLALFGYNDNAELNGKTILDLIAPSQREQILENIRRRASGQPAPVAYETRGLRKDGSEFDMEVHISTYELNSEIYSVPIIRDITQRKRNQRELIILNRAINQSSDAVFLINEQLIFAYVNDAACHSLGYTREELLTMTPSDIDAVITYDAVKDIMDELLANGHYARFETQHKTRDGHVFPVEISSSVVEYDGAKFSLTTVHDITERKRAEENLRLSEEKYRVLAENIPNVVFQCKNDSRYTFIYLNTAIEKLTGYTREDFLEKGLSFFDLYHPDDLKTMPTPEENNITDINRNPFHITYRIRHKSGEWRWVDEWGTGIVGTDGKVEYLEGIMADITERKQHEREREAIISVSTALRQSRTKTGILNIILDQLIALFEVDGAMLVMPNTQNGGLINEMGRGAIGERMTGLTIPPGKGICDWVIKNKTFYLNNQADQDPLFYRPELLGNSRCVACAPLLAQEHAIGALWLARQTDFVEQDVRLLNAIADIAANAIHRVMLHEQTELQLHHLIALHQIDIAISSNFDSNLTLNVILHNVKNELKVDAANILLLDSITHTLDFVAGLGFRTRGIEQSHVKLVDGYAGTAAREYRTVSCPDLKLARDSFSRSSLLADEEFIVQFATPLIVKGQVKGVLELFHRQAFNPESDWVDYFETLATQAAIAIESASLLESLKRSNTELILAYDATIEGWSRALDLRDKETEGHTQRVTDMALALAEKMGISEAEKQHLWRGSLLHDIGKMGVPDSILLKPGPLSEAEKQIMRQHPMYAFQMLSPIAYLKSAMDISYCHHEKWDGSGYPRGLKGEEIPLSARLFAVVDVFDALISDRPYRKAWLREDVYRYIQEQSGRHFDPQIVKLVLENRMW